ncbi:MAG: hypothetical protein SOU19_03940 [Candidatus Caccosoma sp.]|nr:hypothetical protein [Candidatus Caccosoma sp.]
METKKFYELSEDERIAKEKVVLKKTKKVAKKIIIAIFCVVLCLFMVFTLIASIFLSKSDNENSSAHTHAIVLNINN